MIKVYRMQDLECAHCAGKMETAIARLAGVESVSISFMTQKLTIETAEANHEAIMDEVCKICRRIEPDCRVLR